MTSVDMAVLGVMALSGLLACMRGFVREVLSIGAWLGALAVAAASQSAGREIARQWISDPTIASAASFVAILLVSLIVLKLVARSISKMIVSVGLGSVDRTFGLVFGLGRGAAIAIGAYMVAGMATSSDHWPDAVKNARSLPLVYEGAVFVRDNILPTEYRPKLYPPPGGQTPTSDSLLRANPLGRAVLGK